MAPLPTVQMKLWIYCCSCYQLSRQELLSSNYGMLRGFERGRRGGNIFAAEENEWVFVVEYEGVATGVNFGEMRKFS
jgi:hypothetical protein